MQVLAHTASARDGAATFYGRNARGDAVTCTVPNFRTVWVRDACYPEIKRADIRRVAGRGLLATDMCSQFTEYSIRGRPPKRGTGVGWYNRRLGKVEAWYARNSIPPGTWFTRTAFDSDSDMARAADTTSQAWAPFTLMVFDMECLPKADGGFPDAACDPIIQISAVLDRNMLVGEDCECHLWTWRETDAALPQIDEYDPAGCQVHVASCETTMLQEFVQFVQEADPDVISGWNINGFDLPYLIKRCRLSCQLGRAGALARVKQLQNGNTAIEIPGRIVADMLGMWRAQHSERSYKLADVSEHHLGATKAPVHYSDMRRLWDDTRGRSQMATYCLKDSWLVWKLGGTRNVWMNAVQMSKVTYVPLDKIVNGGQQIRVFTLLTHYAHRSGIYIPDDVPETTVGYKGAVVLDPMPGLYRDCVVTLDFASLYPSIMMAFNMCYTTQRIEVTAYELARSLKVPELVATRLLGFVGHAQSLLEAIPADARRYHRCGSVAFAREPRGILPTILNTLLARRKEAKRDMAHASGLAKAVANGKQLALKLVANSIYGFTGAAELGMLPQPQIAAAVTCMGRKLTLGTKAICERQAGVTCVYGDTDSVFLRLEGVTDIAQASRRAEELAAIVDAIIPKPNKLEFEKVYRPLLLRGKKRYCGRKFEEGKGDGELDVKGLEMVRRDNFPLLPAIQREAMEQLVMHDSPQGADQVVRDALTHILAGWHHDLIDFTIAKELTKKPENYAVQPPHVRVARQMTPTPAVRDRIPYVVTRGPGGVGDRAVHPAQFDEAHHELDTHWYAQQITQAMRRLLVLSSPDVDQVFAPVQGTVMATGQSGILRALGAPETLVWRQTHKRTRDNRPKLTQTDLSRYF